MGIVVLAHGSLTLPALDPLHTNLFNELSEVGACRIEAIDVEVSEDQVSNIAILDRL